MDNVIVYGFLYTDEENNDRRMSVYQGIYMPNLPTNTRNYPVVRHLGNVNITQRFFLKTRKFPRKVERQEGDIVILQDTTQLRPIYTILTDLGYDEAFVNLVRDTVVTSSNDKNVMTYEYFQQYRHTYEDMPEDMPLHLVGKVRF